MEKTINTGYAWLSCMCSKDLAKAVARAVEKRNCTMSFALGRGLAKVLDEWGEHELAAMVEDGRGMVTRVPLRHQ